MEDDTQTCWICLGSALDPPPFIDDINHHDSDFIKVCRCSLMAHRGCLTRWLFTNDNKFTIVSDKIPIEFKDIPLEAQSEILKIGKEKFGKDFQENDIDENLQEIVEEQINNNNIWNRLINAIRSLISHNKNEDNNTSLISIKCPQCSYPIFAQLPNNKLINLVGDTKSVFIQTANWSLILSILISGAFGVISSSYLFLANWGSDIINTVFPKSYLPKLFNINNNKSFPSIINIFANRSTNPTYLPFIPISLMSLRYPFNAINSTLGIIFFGRYFKNSFSSAIAMGDENQVSFIMKNFWKPKIIIGLIPQFKFIYDVLFKLTFNRVYYKMMLTLKHHEFIAENFSELELLEIETNEEKLKEKSTSFKEKVKLKFKIWGKELYNCLTRDFSTLLVRKSIFLTMLTTFIWPHIGVLISDLVLKKIPKLCNLGVNPEESDILRNLLGCFIVVVIKDIVNLFLSWLKVKELRQLNILEFGSKNWIDTIVGKWYSNFNP